MISPILVILLFFAEIETISSSLESSPKKRPGKVESVVDASRFRLNSWKCNEVIDSESVLFDLRGDEGRMRNLIEVHVVHNLPGEVELQDSEGEFSMEQEKSSKDKQLHEGVHLNYSVVDVGRGHILVIHVYYEEEKNASISLFWLMALCSLLLIPLSVVSWRKHIFRSRGNKNGNGEEEEAAAVDGTNSSMRTGSSNPPIFSVMNSYEVHKAPTKNVHGGNDVRVQSSSDVNVIQLTPSVQHRENQQIRPRISCSTPGNSLQVLILQSIFVCCVLSSCPPPGSPPTSRLLLNIPHGIRLESVKLFFSKDNNNRVYSSQFSSKNFTRIQIYDLESLEGVETFKFCSKDDARGGRCWNQRDQEGCHGDCNHDHFESLPCSSHLPKVCTVCSTCDASSFEVLPCTRKSDRECLHITGSAMKKEFERGSHILSNVALISSSKNVFMERLSESGANSLKNKEFFSSPQQGHSKENGVSRAMLKSSANVTFDGLGNLGEIRLKRESGLEVVVRVESLETPDHFSDVEYVSDNRFMLEKQDPHEKKRFNFIINHFCRHPIPDFYTITLEMARDRATSAREVTCQSDSGEEKCPDGIKDGQVYLRRSLSSPCSLMGAHPEPLGKEFNSIHCTERTSLLSRIFGKTHSPERSIRFPAKRCRLPIFRCEQCLNQARCSEQNHFANMCCQLDCYALSDCKTTFVEECKSNPVVCGMGDTYRYTLEPMFPYMGSNFSCHVRRSSRGDSESSNNNWVYKIQFHARIASLHLTSPPYKEIISIPKSKQKKSSFKLQVAFMELEHRMESDADLDEDEYILLGHENNEGVFTFQVTNVGKEIPSNSTSDLEGFAGVEETSPSSYVALVKFDEPFVYSSTTWNSTDACHKNTSRMLPWIRNTAIPKLGVELNLETSEERFDYFIRQRGSSFPMVTFKLKDDRSVLAHWFRENDAYLESHSVELSSEADNNSNRIKMVVSGAMSLCPAYLRITLKGLQSHDLLISCPPSFNLTFHLEDKHPHISSYFLVFSSNFRNTTTTISIVKVKQVQILGEEILDLDSSIEDDVNAIQKTTFFTAFWLFAGTLMLQMLMLAIFSFKPEDSSHKWISSCCVESQFNRNKGIAAFCERQKRSSDFKTSTEKVDRHQSPFPGEYSALQPDIGGNWHRPCSRQLQSVVRDRSEQMSTQQNEKSIKLVLIFHFLFWTVYSFLFTLTVFFSFFVGLLNNDTTFTNATRLTIAIQNWTQSVAMSLENNMESLTSKRFSKVTSMTGACENHISDTYDDLVRILKLRERHLKSKDWDSFQYPYKRVFDDFIAKYSKIVSHFVHPAFINPVLNLTLSPSSKYQKYLKKVFVNDWLAFPILLFNKMKQNSSEEDLMTWCKKWIQPGIVCASLETNSYLGEFLEVDEVRAVQQWMTLFSAKFGRRFEEAMHVNFSVDRLQNDARVMSSLAETAAKLDSRHFIQSSTTNTHKEGSLFHLFLNSNQETFPPVQPTTPSLDSDFHRVRLVFLFLDGILLFYRISQALLSSYVLVRCLVTEKMLQRCFINASVDLSTDTSKVYDNDETTYDRRQASLGDCYISKCNSNVRMKDFPDHIYSNKSHTKKIKQSLQQLASPSKPILSSRIACRMLTCASFVLIFFYSLFTVCYVWKPPHPAIQSTLLEMATIINESYSDHSEEEIDFFQSMLYFKGAGQLMEIQNSKAYREHLLFGASESFKANATVDADIPCSYLSAYVYFRITIQDSLKADDLFKDIISVLHPLMTKFFLLGYRLLVLFAVALSLMLLLNTAMLLLTLSSKRKIQTLKTGEPPSATMAHNFASESMTSKNKIKMNQEMVKQSQYLLPSHELSSVRKIDKSPTNLDEKPSRSVEHDTVRFLWNEFKISETHV